ncbi:bile acid:sodium symporter family protein [Candidatus Pelagibacter sp. HIMB1321]|uniref:bile acid:sodium symporter family protein n=1 Tax=Candidatus Pelagibacter sp. HIMB1321 TaxID=1388755 RepID=UPI000A080F62|nr:bile acid:sodium symporter family protein [Candidatus Pelagibacter sp. HIMB1321]SMF77030.1 bile acid:Na+ symporter, BASS family [Candidatus Pelagibacter sp. HIMB1321]
MEVVTKIAPIILALIMLGLGLGLKFEDFTRVLKVPKDFFIGLFSQLIILPIVAYVLILILKTPPEIAIGVMIIAAAPGGVTSNILTKFANGDVALSISLTAVISLISIVTVPLIIFTSADLFGITNIAQNISMLGIALKMFLVVTVPVILGMIIRRYAENFISSKVEIFNKLNIIFFIIFFIAAFYEERENLINFIIQAGLITLILNISMMLIAYYLAKTFASGVKQQKCIALECGLQNGTLAIFVSTQIFGTDILYAIPTGAYAIIMYITGLMFVFFLKNKS